MRNSLALTLLVSLPSLFMIFLGFAFMTFQLPFFQALSALTAHPSKSFVTVQFILFVCLALGSRISDLKKISLINPCFFMATGLAIYLIFNTVLKNSLLGTLLFFAFVSLIGSLCFPLRFNKISASFELSFQARLFATNCLACLAGALLAFLTSLFLGFSITLILSMILYFVSGLYWRKIICFSSSAEKK